MEATTMTNRNPNRSLNDLPDEILLHILSFFPTLDAVQTSLISRKWRPLWSRLRFLKFSYEHFPLNDPPSDNRDFFAEFVDRALILRPHAPIDLFSLSFIYHDRFGFHVDSWVRCAVTLLHARELHLDFFIDREYHQTDETFNHKYDFPFAVLRNGAVRVLKLTRVDLTLPASMAAMGLVSLSSMYLDEVYLTDQMVCDLISGCPNLEELELQNCWGMEKMKICSKKLKKLAFAYIYDSDNRNTIEIDCPNLCSISFDNCSFTQFVLKFAPALVEFSVSIVRIMEQDYGLWSRIVRLLEQAPYVKQLNLQNWWFKLLTSKDPFSKSFMLHNLNHLELRTGYTQCDLIGLAALLELSPNLKNMTLDYVEDGILPEEFSNKPDGFHMPSLRQVTMKSYSGTPDENNFVNILKKHGVVLEKIVIHHIKVGVFPRFTPLFLTNDELVVHLLSGSSFPCLGKLTTNKCKGIMSTPSCPGHLKICCPQLKDVQVVKVVDNLEISGMGLEKLQVEECLSNGSPISAPNRESLDWIFNEIFGTCSVKSIASLRRCQIWFPASAAHPSSFGVLLISIIFSSLFHIPSSKPFDSERP